jgi:hypothetical protein
MADTAGADTTAAEDAIAAVDVVSDTATAEDTATAADTVAAEDTATAADTAMAEDTATAADTVAAEDTATAADTAMAEDTTTGADTVADTTAAVDTVDCSLPSTQTVCVDGVPNKVYKADACGNATTPKTTCSSALACEVNSGDGQAYCACPLTGANTCKLGGSISSLYEVTYIAKQRSCASAVPDPADFVADCGFGTVCFQEAEYNGGAPLCHRSIDASQAGKPYYDFGCGTFSEWLRHPTRLEIDCRCRTTGDGQGGAGGTGNAFADPNHTDVATGGRPGGPIINCGAPNTMAANVWPVAYGAGPSFNAWLQQNASGASWFSGVVNPATREMFAIVRWTNADYVKSGTVVAWDLDTGDRRVVSGLYPNPQLGQEAFGSGYLSPKPGNTGTVTEQPLSGANVLRFGPDGMLYVFGGGTGETSASEREIVRVDPDTGARTLVWLAQNDATGDVSATYGQCFRPDTSGGLPQSVALQAQAFEVGPDGTFYVSMRGVREGDGILSISADGAACAYRSRWGGQGHDGQQIPAQIGAGFALQFPVQGLLLHDGAIFGVSNDDLYRFDLTTGQRTKASYTNGTYGGMGFANMFWDPTREVVWAVGTAAPYVGSIVDLTTGRRESIYADTGNDEYGAQAILRSVYAGSRSVSGTMLSNGNSIGYGAVVLDPDDPNIVYGVLKSGGLMKLELSTFNNYVHSW